MVRPALYVLAAAAALLAAPDAGAQQMIYQPRNPAFGGAPANYSWMLSSAQVQNSYTEEESEDDQLADFERNLQRRILSDLSRQLAGDQFDGLDLTQQGTFDFGDFLIDITPGIDGVTIRVFNVLTGDESTITIPSLP